MSNWNDNQSALFRAKETAIATFGKNGMMQRVSEKIRLLELNKLSLQELRVMIDNTNADEIEAHPIYWIAVYQAHVNTPQIQAYRDSMVNMMDQITYNPRKDFKVIPKYNYAGGAYVKPNLTLV